ncbi:MAG: PKD domain-containing protein [Candidatus Hodarchaeota archaeon]
MDVPTSTYNLIVTPPIQSGLAPKTIPEVEVTEDRLIDIYLVPSQVISFSGYMLDRSEEAIPYQSVQLYPWAGGSSYQAKTDGNGFFSVNILPGDYELQLSGGDYAGMFPGLPVPNSFGLFFYDLSPLSLTEDTTMTFILQERYLSGTVVDPLGNGVPDVQITMHGNAAFAGFQDGYWSSYTTSGEYGEFSLVAFTCQSNLLQAIPPEGSQYGPIDLYDIDLQYDKTLIIIITPFQTPPNAVTGSYYGVEGTAINLDASESSDPDGFIELYEWDVDGDGSFDISSTASISNFIPLDNYEGSIVLQVTDNEGLTSQITTEIVIENVAPILSDIIAPIDPIALGTPLLASASFNDPGILDTHSAIWDWGDGTTSSGVITEEAGSGTVDGNHEYTEPGVYTITLTLSDNDGGLASTQFSYIVVYDNEQGFVTGGGWYTSPEGAYIPDPSLTGKATFGFVAKYQKGATTPTGATTFIFHVADLKFQSKEYDWLVVAGKRAQFKGIGQINDVNNYGFLLTAIDGDLNGGDGVDKFRIKIWDRLTDTIIYDNQLGSEDDSPLTTPIEGGSIVIHGDNGIKASTSIFQEETDNIKFELLSSGIHGISKKKVISSIPQFALLLSLILIIQIIRLKFREKMI